MSPFQPSAALAVLLRGVCMLSDDDDTESIVQATTVIAALATTPVSAVGASALATSKPTYQIDILGLFLLFGCNSLPKASDRFSTIEPADSDKSCSPAWLRDNGPVAGYLPWLHPILHHQLL